MINSKKDIDDTYNTSFSPPMLKKRKENKNPNKRKRKGLFKRNGRVERKSNSFEKEREVSAGFQFRYSNNDDTSAENAKKKQSLLNAPPPPPPPEMECFVDVTDKIQKIEQISKKEKPLQVKQPSEKKPKKESTQKKEKLRSSIRRSDLYSESMRIRWCKQKTLRKIPRTSKQLKHTLLLEMNFENVRKQEVGLNVLQNFLLLNMEAWEEHYSSNYYFLHLLGQFTDQFSEKMIKEELQSLKEKVKIKKIPNLENLKNKEQCSYLKLQIKKLKKIEQEQENAAKQENTQKKKFKLLRSQQRADCKNLKIQGERGFMFLREKFHDSKYLILKGIKKVGDEIVNLQDLKIQSKLENLDEKIQKLQKTARELATPMGFFKGQLTHQDFMKFIKSS